MGARVHITVALALALGTGLPANLAAAPADTKPASTKAVEAKAVEAKPAEAKPGESRASETVSVMIDHAKVIRLPERSQTVVVGNPSIADVTLQKNGVVIVTGKAYGVTNLIAIDGTGALLAESLISVRAPTESLITVQRGLERESFSCTPKCQPSMLLGDSTKYFGEVSGQTSARNQLATQK